MKTFAPAFVLAAASVFALAAPFGISTAEAGRGDSEIYQQSYQFNQPMHGYEGFAPNSRKYCSYKRLPQRECGWDARKGREICKIVGWELEQTCY